MNAERTDPEHQARVAQVMQVYIGSDGGMTRALYEALEERGPAGRVATNLFRAVKCSERAKRYRGRGFKASAYERKEWSLGNLCEVLERHADELGIKWGWSVDEAQAYHDKVLYVELERFGQVSFHAAERLGGPDFTGQWDGARGSAPQRVCAYVAAVLAVDP